jgi:zinc D-Ala-D-Ala carboxypeptidase
MTFFAHWHDVPATAWRWPNFSPAEIACRGTGKLLVNEAALDALQALRKRLGKPLIVRSAYRSPEHNRSVGGAKASKHMDGIAFDVAMANHDPEAFEAAARTIGFKGFGFYPRSGFIHIDLGRRGAGASASRNGQRPSPPRRRRRGRCWPRAAL